MLIHFQKQLGGFVIRISKQDTQDSCPRSSAQVTRLRCHLREPEAGRRRQLPTYTVRGLGLPCGPVVKNPPCSAGDVGWILGGEAGTPHASEQLSLCPVITEKINKYSERAACLFVRGFPGVVFGCSFSQDFPGGPDGKASVYNVRDLGSIPGLGRFPGEGNGNPL